MTNPTTPEQLLKRKLPDLTYDRNEINSDPVWKLAFVLSEIMNDNAPIGWSRFIWVAECLLANYEITERKEKWRGRAIEEHE